MLPPTSVPTATTGAAAAFPAEVASFLCAERFSHQRAASFHGRALLVVRSPVASLALHLLPTPRCAADVLPPSTASELSDAYVARCRRGGRRRRTALVHLWEDQWSEHREIVCSRLLSMLGRSTRLMARATTARRIDAATLDAFLLDNHLWGTTKARYRYGLYTKPREGDSEGAARLVAVASFSARWKVRRRGPHDAPRASHELIRYCSCRGESVVGGISKLLKAFARDAAPDEVVTVIDRDWGAGGGWATLGFRPLKRLPPVTFYVGPDGLRRHPGSGPNPHRRRLPAEVIAALEEEQAKEDDHTAAISPITTSGVAAAAGAYEAAAAAERLLAARGYYAVRDAGAERHLLLLTPRDDDDAPSREGGRGG